MKLIILFPPWEESSEAFTLGVHLILLYFIRISLLTPKIYVLFSVRWEVGGGWWATFWFFKSLNNMVFNLGIDVYVHKRNLGTTKVLLV